MIREDSIDYLVIWAAICEAFRLRSETFDVIKWAAHSDFAQRRILDTVLINWRLEQAFIVDDQFRRPILFNGRLYR